MAVSASDLGPARLRLAAEAAKREALMLASEWGTPLAPIPGYLAEAFRSPFGEHAQYLINCWEEDMNDLGNHLFRLSSACEAAADEEAAIAHVVADGLTEPSRYQDLASAFILWESRPRQRRLLDASHADPDGLVVIDPGGIRRAAAKLDEASTEFDAARRRLEGSLRDVKLEVPEELCWVAEDSTGLAAELRSRADAYELADGRVGGSMAGVFPGWSSGLLGPSLDVLRARSTPSDPRVRAQQDLKHFLDEVRPTGALDRVDMANARAILAEAGRTAAEDTAYAAAFLEALGPKNLRWLIEQGEMDSCVLSDLVARASSGGTPLQFLRTTLGTGREAPRRAAILSRCPTPSAQFDAAWVELMAVTLLKGRNTSTHGDARRWYREATANLLRGNPAGAISFINTNEKLACQLLSRRDQGGTAAQAALDEILGSSGPPSKATEDALERIIRCEARHEFGVEGKRALARALARPNSFLSVTWQIARRRGFVEPASDGFNPGYAPLKTVLGHLMVDQECRQTLLRSAQGLAADRVRKWLAAPGTMESLNGLREAGAAFGSLGSHRYSLQAALDVQNLSAAMAKSLVDAVRGATLEIGHATPLVSVAIEGGSAILFDATEAHAEQQRLAHDLFVEQGTGESLTQWRGDLMNHLEHTAYASVLSDKQQLAKLGLRMSPDDLPSSIPPGLDLNVTERSAWAQDLFNEKGELVVPLPTDVGKWKSFTAWARTVNPQLQDRVDGLTDPMFATFKEAALL